MAENTENTGRRHYIIVVHGMGEQKCNVTAPPVVEHFAAHRNPALSPEEISRILPATLSQQTLRNDGIGHGWAEFNGIPINPHHSQHPPFDGSPADSPEGENFRFVDLHWQFILQDDIGKFGSSTEVWSKKLLQKLEKEARHDQDLRDWGVPMLDSIIKTALPIKNMVALKYSAVTKYVFDGFLGDVHLYGDFSRARGRAVRHFHTVLDEIMIRDFLKWYWNVYRPTQELPPGERATYTPPEFTILAHSLGSIMSFDALVYAHAEADLREKDSYDEHPCASLPFPGYTYIDRVEKKNRLYLLKKLHQVWHDSEEMHGIVEQLIPEKQTSLLAETQLEVDEERCISGLRPVLAWKNQVRHFITIGSPIDKFVVMWPENYRHLDFDYTSTPNVGFEKRNEKIEHFNFCDEQDPVGHHINRAMDTKLYTSIFSTYRKGNHDVVFRRYGIPGLAHNLYWSDKQLFSGMLDKIIDPAGKPPTAAQPPSGSENFIWSDLFQDKEQEAFSKSLRWGYDIIPFVTALITALLTSYAFYAGNLLWQTAAGLLAILLWTRPGLISAYRKELDPEQEIRKTDKLKLTRGIFSRLIYAAIEWRRILIIESQGSNVMKGEETKANERVTYQSQEMTNKTHEHLRKEWTKVAFLFLAAAVVFITISYGPLSDLLSSAAVAGTVMNTVFLLILGYACVRVYVIWTFYTVWKKLTQQGN